MIADGNGPSFTFAPGNAGTYTVTFTVSDEYGGGGSAQVVITSEAVQPVITPPASTQTVGIGIDTTVGLGTLAVAGVGPWTATVEWGDGATSTFYPAGSGPLALAHDYTRPGTFTIDETVSEYDGDTGAASFSIDVTSAGTATTLGASSTSAVYGQSVTFTAVVVGDSLASGTVAFDSGSTQIGTGTLKVVDGQDEATFTTSSLAVVGSPYAITAVYEGDSTHQGSTSNVVDETISPDATTTTASSSATSPDFGQALTLSADVTANAPGSGSPTGSVDFYDTTTQVDLGSVEHPPAARPR